MYSLNLLVARAAELLVCYQKQASRRGQRANSRDGIGHERDSFVVTPIGGI